MTISIQQAAIDLAVAGGLSALIGSLLHGNKGRGDGKWHFKWWDGQTLRVLVDMRLAPRGDFSRAAVLVTD
jgi:hypothetical protein